jgi:hypothetical protein
MSYSDGILYALETFKKRANRNQIYFFDKIETRSDYMKNIIGKTEEIKKTYLKHNSELKNDDKVIIDAIKANCNAISVSEYRSYQNQFFIRWSKLLKLKCEL